MVFVTALRRTSFYKQLVFMLLCPGLMLWPIALPANPSGGQVVKGSAEIIQDIEGVLQILQESDSAVIEWEDFSIDAGELAQFLQPGKDSATLNRVTSGAISQLMGDLRANGKVLLINPNGIVIGSEGVVDTAGFIASTLDVDDDEFMAGGDMVFKGESEGAVINMGRISSPTGDVFLISRTVDNQGEISTPNGTTGLAAGQEVLLLAVEDANGERIFVRPSGVGGQVNNSGLIDAASAELKAKGGLYQTAINNEGTVKATSVVNRGGRIFLRAGSSGPNGVGGTGGGNIVNTGELIAKDGDNGGEITINAGDGMAEIGGLVDASGDQDGGKIEIVGSSVEVMEGAELTTEGAAGTGGEIRIGKDEVTEAVVMAQNANLNAGGGSAGGSIVAESSGAITSGAEIEAIGGTGQGGEIDLLGDEVSLEPGSVVRADGETGGGTIRIGGGFQGRDSSVRNAAYTTIAPEAEISVDALGAGNAGTVIVWSDGNTVFEGSISAQSLGTGDGGFVEVSGKGNLTFSGEVNALAADGETGTVLLDPTNFTITNLPGGGPNTIDEAALELALTTANYVIATGAGAGDGLITIETGADVDWANANSLSLLAHGNIRAYGSLQNSGTGAVNLIAGWDGSTGWGGGSGPDAGGTFSLGAIMGDINSWGNTTDGGLIEIGSNSITESTQLVAIGSLGGQTSLLGYGVTVIGSDSTDDAASQVGYHGAGAVGDILVYTKTGGLNVEGGTATNSEAQIGHGGRGIAGSLAGDITVDTTMQGASGILYVSGYGSGSYAQIGHGGAGAVGSKDGDITVEANRVDVVSRGSGVLGYSQIGHGGVDSSGNIGATTGDISVHATAGQILVWGGLVNNTTNFTYAQIGHGGLNSGLSGESISGDVDVVADAGNIQLLGSRANATDAYTHIGHAGENSNYSADGAVTVNAGGFLELRGAAHFNSVMIGHGGTDSTGDFGGAIDVDAAGDILLNSGYRSDDYVQIGHGGNRASGTAQGGISVISSGGSITLAGATGNVNSALDRQYVQVGHGGFGNTGTFLGVTDDLIEVRAEAGSVTLTGGDGGDDRFMLIGNGGTNSTGTKAGDIQVYGANGVSLNGGEGLRAYAQVGHGGSGASGAAEGDIIVTSDGLIDVTAYYEAVDDSDGLYGEASYAQIGHGGSGVRGNRTGTIQLSGAGLDVVGGWYDAYAQVGHGGSLAGDDNTGLIDIDMSGDINVQGGFASRAYSQIGHGGYNADTGGSVIHTGEIQIDATNGGSLNIIAGNGPSLVDYLQASAQVGHGGTNTAGTSSSPITVNVAGGVELRGGDNTDSDPVSDQEDAYAQLGHGGSNADGAYGGNISVIAVDDIDLYGGDGRDSYAQIGHGGRDESSGDNVADIYVETTSGGIHFFGGNGTAGTEGEWSYAQIGNGGAIATGSHGGNITVISADDLTMELGRRDVTYKQIGHGGSDNSGSDTDGNLSGTITVQVENNILLEGGINDISYAQIGHGGRLHNGNHTSDLISVTSNSGSITVEAGRAGQSGTDGRRTYAQIGLGGAQGGGIMDADIVVQAATGVFVEGGGREFNYAMIGNGGYDNDGAKSGNITVTSGGSVTVDGGTLQALTFAQIGHGGQNSTGDMTGNISIAADGIVRVQAHQGDESYAQIGHGGLGTGGNHSGAILVDASGALTVTSGSALDAYGMIGHGDAAGLTSGTRIGDILVASDTSLTLDDTAGNQAGVGHRSSGGVNDSDVALLSPVITFTNTANTDFIDGNTSYGLYSLGDLEFNGGVTFDSLTPFQVWAVGDIQFNDSLVNLGGGAINVAAGWDGDTGVSPDPATEPVFLDAMGVPSFATDFAAIEADAMSWGDDTEGGVVSIGSSTATTATIVGSRNGETNVYGYGVNVQGGTDDAYAHLGFHTGANPGDASGDIMVFTKDGGLTVAGGTGTNAEAQVGHGGRDSDGSVVGDIIIDGNGSGSVAVTANGTGSYAHIGHGGFSHGDEGNASAQTVGAGDLLQIRAVNDVTLNGGDNAGAYAMIGYGGTQGAGRLEGNIDIQMGGAFSMTAGDASDAYAHIGHGGRDNTFNNEGGTIKIGNILIDGFESFTMQAGNGNGAYTQIGHGGFNGNDGKSGNITLTGSSSNAGVMSLTGGASNVAYSQIGHGGTNAARIKRGEIEITNITDLILTGGDNANHAYAQIGLGGRNSNGPPEGGITIEMSGDLNLDSGSRVTAYTQIGSGGYDLGNLRVDDDISLDVGGSVTLQADGGYAQIGHGGTNSASASNGGRSGNIDLTAGGPISLTGGSDVEGYAQIGHGGYNTTVNAIPTEGDVLIETTVGAVTVEGGTGYAQIGHGGEASGDASLAGSILVAAPGAIQVTSSADAYAMIGHGDGNGLTTGDRIGDILVDSGTSITTNSSAGEPAGIGHRTGSGSNANDTALVAPAVNLTGSEPFIAGNSYGIYAVDDLAFNGALSFDSAIPFNVWAGGSITFNASLVNNGTGPVNVAAGWDQDTGITPDSGADPLFYDASGVPNFSQDFSAITGDGASWGNNSGGVTLDASTATVDVGSDDGKTTVLGYGVSLLGGNGTNERAQIGYGVLSSGEGDIEVQAKDGGVTLTAGTGNRAFAKIGHGRNRTSTTATGSILVETDGAVSLAAGTNASSIDSFAQIGHGGIAANGNQGNSTDTIVVNAGTGVSLQGDEGQNAYALIGNGGLASSGSVQADITVTTQTGNITLTASTSTVANQDDAFAQIGNTAVGAAASTQGTITVQALAGEVILNAGGGATSDTPNFAQIGHGGAESRGSFQGQAGDMILVEANAITLNGGTDGQDAYAQIGNGGMDSTSLLAGDVVVRTNGGAGTITLNGGTTPNGYAQIGNGGYNSSGDASGKISVEAGTDVTLQGGSDSNAYAQIGHGGADSSGNYDAPIYVEAGNDVDLIGGTETSAYAQIGHGDGVPTSTGDVAGDIYVQAGSQISTNDSAGGNVGISHRSLGMIEGDTALFAPDLALDNGTFIEGDSFGLYNLSGDITLDSNFEYNSATQFNVWATGDVNVFAQVLNNGTGAINIVAGWDGTTGINYDPLNTRGSNVFLDAAGCPDFDAVMADIKGDEDSWGDGGSVFVNEASRSSSARIGSRFGMTNALGYSVVLQGASSGYAQIGYRGTGSADGDIWVMAQEGGVGVYGGAGGSSHALIGHGGAGGNMNGDLLEGSISIESIGDVSIVAGNVGDSSYAKVGHGAQSLTGDVGSVDDLLSITTSGDILLQGSGQNNGWAHIGAGGLAAGGNPTLRGDISLSATNISLMGGLPNATIEDDGYAIVGNSTVQTSGSGIGDITVNATGTLQMIAGAGNVDPVNSSVDTPNFTQIGHGGHANTGGNHSGSIDVRAGDIIMTAGTREESYSQIGHGGFNSDGSSNGQIVVIANSIDMNAGTAPEAYVQIGHGGVSSDADNTGDIYVNYDPMTTAASGGTGDITLNGGTVDSYAYAQIGHGGALATGFQDGNITIGAAQNILMEGGSGNQSYAKIGTRGNGGADGDINITAAGNVSVMGGTGGIAFSQIGHGDVSRTLAQALEGNIILDVGGDITLQSGDGTSGAFTQIGHGGTLLNGDLGVDGDIIEVTADGDIRLSGSTQDNSWSMIGNGGLASNNGDRIADITVTSTNGNITVQGGGNSGSPQDDGFAMIGNGGAQSNTSTVDQDIRVSAVNGTISLLAGAGNIGTPSANTPNFAQIGNGGHNNSGDHSGQIVVLADSIVMQGGTRDDSYAQIGQGGYGADGDHSGDIFINYDPDTMTIVGGGGTVTMDGGTSARTYAQIGHGGATTTGTKTGDILVADAASLSMSGSGETDAYAQIGHGGSNGSGTVTGKIMVSTSGNLGVSGAAGDGAYGQIGHGGLGYDAALDGQIYVSAGNTVSVAGGSGTDAYGMIGHGDGVPTGTGNRTGDVYITGAAINSSSGGAQVGFGHRTAGGNVDGDTALVAPSLSLGGGIFLGGSSFGAYSLTGDIDFDGDAFYNSDQDFNIWAAGDVNFNARVQNQGSGALNVMAGWDPTNGLVGPQGPGSFLDLNNCPDFTLTAFTTLKADATAWGNNMGLINLGSSTATQGASVGSRTGTTNLIGYGVNLRGSDTTILGYSRVGYEPLDSSDDASGDIMIHTQEGGLEFVGGSAPGGFTQVGHGQSSAGNAQLSGDIMINLARGTSAGDLLLNAGGGPANGGSYAQIGHGFAVWQGDISGDILLEGDNPGDAGAANVLLAAGSGTNAVQNFAQIGHGAVLTEADMSGDIILNVENQTTLTGGAGGTRNYAQVGHGGYQAAGNLGDGDDVIMVTSGGDITLNRGLDINSYAQIGNGGSDILAGDTDGSRQSDIVVRSTNGNVNFTEGGANFSGYSQIGHGGFLNDGDKSGTIEVYADNGAINLMSGRGTDGYSQIGHGGGESTGNLEGDITVQAGGLLFVGSGDGDRAYAQIGHGGFGASGDLGSADDVVMVTAVNDITLQGGTGTGAYAQIGYGGGDDTAGDNDGTRDAKIVVRSTDGGVTMTSGDGDQAYTQIGHGGYQDDADMNGGVYVFADNGDLTMNAGAGADAYSLIGHGAANGATTGTRMGDIWAQASGAVSINSNGANAATIGHLTDTPNGVSNGNLAIIGDTLFLGNGAGIGIGSMLNGDADTLLAATGSNLTLEGDILYNGSGDLDVVAAGDVRVRSRVQNSGTGDVNLIAGWDGSTGLATVDHLVCPPVTGDFFNNALLLDDPSSYGGTVFVGSSTLTQPAAAGSFGGTTRVASDDLRVYGSDTTAGAYAQLGYSTHTADADPLGDIVATLNGDLLVFGGDANQAEAFIGHGGGGGDVSGDITITAASADIRGGAGTQSFGQVGHNSTSSAMGTTTINVTEDIAIRGGGGDTAFAKVGHGSTSANGDYYGDIFLSAEDGKQEGNASDDKNDIKLERGSGSDAYAQVGHGDFLFTSGKGASGNGDREGNIQIRAGSDVISDGGMIGHVDPKTSNGTSQDSNLVVAVSRDQPRSILGATILGEDIPPNDGVGRIIARNGASFAAPSDSQLRFYVPTREGVKVEAGTQINGMSFTPVKIDDPRTLFETARVQVTNGGITIIRPWVPLFQTATEDDPFFDSVFFESFVFYYDSLLADEPGAILDFIFESGFDNSRDRIEDLESALDAIPESSDFKIGFRPGDEAPNPYSTWWLVTLQEGDEYMLELDPSGVIYVWKMNNPDDPSDSDDLTVTEHTGGQDPLEGAE